MQLNQVIFLELYALVTTSLVCFTVLAILRTWQIRGGQTVPLVQMADAGVMARLTHCCCISCFVSDCTESVFENRFFLLFSFIFIIYCKNLFDAFLDLYLILCENCPFLFYDQYEYKFRSFGRIFVDHCVKYKWDNTPIDAHLITDWVDSSCSKWYTWRNSSPRTMHSARARWQPKSSTH